MRHIETPIGNVGLRLDGEPCAHDGAWEVVDTSEYARRHPVDGNWRVAYWHEPEVKPEAKPEQAPVQQQVAAKPNKVEGTQTTVNGIPQTGDASGAAIAVTAAAGLSMVGVAEILRRRREAQNRA